MQKAPLNDNPLEGSPTRWTKPWHLWFDSLFRSVTSLIAAITFTDLADTPSTYTGQAGKVVKVKGAEDGLEFGQPDHTLLSNIGTNTHAQIDTHIGDATIHFTEGSIDHTAITNIGTNSHSAIDSHIGDASIHFTEVSIDHTAIQNIGTNSHAAIDTHIADAGLHNLVFDQLSYTYTLGKETGEVISLSASPLKTLVKTYDTSGNIATVTDGVSTWTFSYNGAGFLTGSVKT